MYSLTPYVVLMVQLALGLLMELFKLVGWIESPPVHATMESWLTLNWPSIVLFIYSFIFLFYMGEWLDNHRRVDLKILLPMLCSMVINTMLAGWAQVVGLFKHRHQTNWVKNRAFHQSSGGHDGTPGRCGPGRRGTGRGKQRGQRQSLTRRGGERVADERGGRQCDRAGLQCGKNACELHRERAAPAL